MVLAQLRQKTAALHEAVEARVDLLSPDLTVERYIRILQVFHAFFSRCERELEGACPEQWRDLWSRRRKAERLEYDLAALSSAPDPSLQGDVPEARIRAAGDWLGALYVLEGSALGGQVISRHLERHFGWSGGRGYSFFEGLGAGTAARWKGVCLALESSPLECNQIVEGAHLTLNRLNVCLEATL